MRVLVIEDNEAVGDSIRRMLEAQRYAANVVADGEAGLDYLVSRSYDVAVVDVGLPKMDGFQVARSARQAGVHTPILMLTARDAVEDRVAGLRCGADDYLVKPFVEEELLARLEAMVRRAERPFVGVVTSGKLRIDLATRSVDYDGTGLTLGATEFRVLEFLARNAGIALTRSQIVERIWDYDFDGSSNIVDVYVSQLRRKFVKLGAKDVIETVWGIGYRFPQLLTAHSRSLALRTAALYLAVFVCVLLALSVGAYAFVWREYVSMLSPALSTPEGAAALHAAMRRVALTIVEFDVPLIIVVAVASYALARTAIAPLEAARDRERQFAADAAHGLRSPLAAIVAVAQAGRARAGAAARDDFDTIARNALEASDAIANLLTLARHPGPAVLQREPVDLAAIVVAVSRELAPVAANRSVELQVEAGNAIVDGDERRLREMARNLLDNAIRHARTRARIASHRNGNSGDVIVDDDGDGIAPAERQRVFERYYRHHDDGSGTGLGLAIVRWVARAHGGDVVAGSASHGGARFVASIPARDV